MNIMQPSDEDIMTKHLREMNLNRKRVAKFYEKNREAIKQRRRDRYAANKKQVSDVLHRLTPAAAAERHTPHQVGVVDFTLDDVLLRLKNDTLIDKKKTRDTYMSGVRRIFATGECEHIIACMKNYIPLADKIIQSVDPKSGLPYSVNTLVGRFQTVLYLMDKYYREFFSVAEYKTIHSYYEQKLKIYKILSKDQTIENKKRSVPSFPDYLDTLLEHFEYFSKEHLVAKLFSTVTGRTNDYSKMVIIDSDKDDDLKQNFVVVNGNDKIRFIFNTFKTENAYDRFEFKFTSDNDDLAELIHWWIAFKNKKLGGLFLERGGDMSPYINDMHRTIGYQPEANLFRHMRASEEMPSGLTAEERAKRIVDLSEMMMHSPATNIMYQRQLIKKIQPPVVLETSSKKKVSKRKPPKKK